MKLQEGRFIQGLRNMFSLRWDMADPDEIHNTIISGAKLQDGQIVTNGGRVLGVTAKGKDLKEARANAYAATEWVQFENKYMRHDIGKAIDEV